MDERSLRDSTDFRQYIGEMYDQIRSSVEDAQRDLERVKDEEFTAETPDHMVSATVSGMGEITDLKVHVLAKRRMDSQTLGETITDVIQTAEQRFRERQQSIFQHFKINGKSFDTLLSDPTSCVPDLNRSE